MERGAEVGGTERREQREEWREEQREEQREQREEQRECQKLWDGCRTLQRGKEAEMFPIEHRI